MDMKQLRYFARIVELGSFSKAAEALRIAQPALSQQMANLEGELGIKLLVRTSSGTHPTDAGRALYRSSCTIQKQMDQALAEMRDHTASPVGKVAVGLPMSVASVLAVPLLQTARRQLPRVVLRLVEGSNDHLGEMLANCRLDIALLYAALPQRGTLARTKLIEDLGLVSQVSHGGGIQDPIALRDLARLDLILPSCGTPLRTILEAAGSTAGTPLNVVAEVHALPTLRSAVMAGLGHTVLPWSAVADDIAAGRLMMRRIVHPEIRRPVTICTPEIGEPSEAARRVLGSLEALCHSLLECGKWKGVHTFGSG